MKKTPGIVFACEFVTAKGASDLNLKFSDHAIGYIGRDKAQLNKSEISKSEMPEPTVTVTKGGYLGREYATNPFYKKDIVEGHEINFGFDEEDKICVGCFTAEKDELTSREKNILMNKFMTVQKNENCLYTSVISFENDFLAKNGIDPLTPEGQKRLRECTRLGAAELFKNSHLDINNLVWSAAIHYNTKHIHIHLDFAEVNATHREKNMIDVKAFDRLKSAVANKIIDNPYSLSLNQIVRESLIIKMKTNIHEQQDLITPLIANLPKNIPWEYNRKKMLPYRSLINQTVDKIISADPELKAQRMKLDRELRKYRDYLHDVYGEGKRDSADTGVKNKLADFYERCGNAVLKEAKILSSETEELQLINKEIEISDGIRQTDAHGGDNKFDHEDTYFNQIYKKALAHDIYSIYRLGKMFEYGNNTEKNIEAAMFLYAEAAKYGYVAAEYKLGKYADDETTKLKHFTAAAERGHPAAMFQLGKMYEKSDLGLSEEWYKKAGLADNAWATLRLIRLYENRKEEFPDITQEDIQRLQKEAFLQLSYMAVDDPDNVHLHMQLANMYFNGIGCDKNIIAAIHHLDSVKDDEKVLRELRRFAFDPSVNEELKKQADNHISDAVEALETLNSVKSGIKPYAEFSSNYNSAVSALQNLQFDAAIDKLETESLTGNVYALYDLGKIYHSGLGVEKDDEKAQQLFQAALFGMKQINKKEENASLEYRIGKMQRDGLGVTPDVAQAINYFERSAAQGNDFSKMALADIFSDKSGPFYHPEKALKNLESAAETNDNAKYMLAKFYLSCPDIEPQPKKAIALLEEIAPKNSSAKYTLGCVYLDKNNPEYNSNKGVEHLKQLVVEKNDKAMLRLAFYYLRAGDRQTGNNYLHLAAAQKNEFAIKYLNSPHYQKMGKAQTTCFSSARTDYKIQKKQIALHTSAAMKRLNREYQTHIQDLKREFEYEQTQAQRISETESIHY